MWRKKKKIVCMCLSMFWIASAEVYWSVGILADVMKKASSAFLEGGRGRPCLPVVNSFSNTLPVSLKVDALHCEFCLFASCAWHHQHLCMSVCIPEPWATYSKRLTGHEFCIVCAGKWLVCSGVRPPRGDGTVTWQQSPPRVGGGGPLYDRWGWTGHGDGGGYDEACIIR